MQLQLAGFLFDPKLRHAFPKNPTTIATKREPNCLFAGQFQWTKNLTTFAKSEVVNTMELSIVNYSRTKGFADQPGVVVVLKYTDNCTAGDVRSRE